MVENLEAIVNMGKSSRPSVSQAIPLQQQDKPGSSNGKIYPSIIPKITTVATTKRRIPISIAADFILAP